jgi:DMSO/TMAO reductase YedYZ molybdopterin-dependent catalytic subunit
MSTTRPRIISPDTLRGSPRDRTPPAQALTAKWPVLHYGGVPKVDPHQADWSLRVFGLVDEPYELTYDEIRAMPATDVVCDMHCVTHWSRLDNVFTGVPTKTIIDRAKPKPEARFVMCHSEAGFTVNVPLAEFTREDCLLAWAWDGKDITPDHGWPLRGLVPRLYLWKSAKWIRGIELRATGRRACGSRFVPRNRGRRWRGARCHGSTWRSSRGKAAVRGRAVASRGRA